jgi:hypothetical protein
MGSASSKRLASLLLAAWCVLACGRTEKSCSNCAEAGADRVAGSGGLNGTGGAGTGGAVGGSAGASAGDTFTRAGQGGDTDFAFLECPLRGLPVHLTRYSAIDLERTLDAVIGTGPSLFHDTPDRSDLGPARFAHETFTRSLIDGARARTDVAVVYESALQVCPAEQLDRSGCVDAWIREQGLRLYRRPLNEPQVAGYVNQFVELSASGSATTAARMVLFTMLLSPYFVFRVELGYDSARPLESPPRPGGTAPPPPTLPNPPDFPRGTQLDAFEVAARLSHFLSRQAPDDELLATAQGGTLLREADLLRQVDRLLQTSAARSARRLQHVELLHLEAIGQAPESDPESSELRAQLDSFIDDVLQHRDGSLKELLSSPRQPLNRSLASRYGITLELGDELELVDLDPRYYAGVLTQGAWFARSPRPTLRGLHVYDHLLCNPPPPPPANVPMDGLVGTTPREQILNATANPACRACHEIFTPAGFALEAFDAVGALTGYPTDGELRLRERTEPVALAGPPELGQAIAGSSTGKACLARRYVEHLLERPLDTQEDAAWFDCLSQRYPLDADLGLNQLARLVATSDATLRTARPVLHGVFGVSQAVDPIAHAIEETLSLREGYSDEADRIRLDSYRSSLRAYQEQLPQP